MRPRITIGLATYQGARHLQAQLDSLVAQQGVEWRLISSDDGSTDGTLTILRRFAGIHPDTRIIQGPNRGATQNFLHLIGQVPEGDWLALCDQDDVWKPDRLARGVAMIGTDPAPAATSSRTTICDENLHPVRPAPLYRRPPAFRNALVQACLPGNTFLANPAALALLQRGAPAAAAANVISHDWWIYQLLTGSGARVIRDPAQTVLYRQHGGNVMGRNDTLRAKAARAALLSGGDFGRWLHENTTALSVAQDLLTPQNSDILDRFRTAITEPGPLAAARLAALGVYRQTRAQSAALFAAAAAGRLRG